VNRAASTHRSLSVARQARAGRRARLGPALEGLYRTFDRVESATDPVHIVRRFTRPDDREVVGFLAAALAFGRVASVLQSIEALLALAGPSPAAYVRRFDPARERTRFAALGHRWIRGADLVALVRALQRILVEAGSIEAFFAAGDDPLAVDVGQALDSFSARALDTGLGGIYQPGATRRVGYFFPRPSSGSACKRLNLFLRWMVRRDAIDLGVWSRVAPARLVVPLDTHVIRVGRCLGLTRYASPGWKMAAEITASLRALNPADPIRYDFSLCHVGMMGACGFGRSGSSARCPLRGACAPRKVERWKSGKVEK